MQRHYLTDIYCEQYSCVESALWCMCMCVSVCVCACGRMYLDIESALCPVFLRRVVFRILQFAHQEEGGREEGGAGGLFTATLLKVAPRTQKHAAGVQGFAPPGAPVRWWRRKFVQGHRWNSICVCDFFLTGVVTCLPAEFTDVDKEGGGGVILERSLCSETLFFLSCSSYLDSCAGSVAPPFR